MTQQERLQLDAVIDDLDALREWAPGQAMYDQRRLKIKLGAIIETMRGIVGEPEAEAASESAGE